MQKKIRAKTLATLKRKRYNFKKEIIDIEKDKTKPIK